MSEARAVRAGLNAHSSVTKKTRLLIAADPDSMSGKAAKAKTYRLPVVGEATFSEMLAALELQAQPAEG